MNLYHFLANTVVLFHFLFILFAIFGALLVVKWPWLIYLHLPTLVWAVGIELVSGVCPLTPLENWLRDAAGREAYSGGFIEHYILPIIYPAGLTNRIQVFMGVFLLLFNVLVYSWIYFRK